MKLKLKNYLQKARHYFAQHLCNDKGTTKLSLSILNLTRVADEPFSDLTGVNFDFSFYRNG